MNLQAAEPLSLDKLTNQLAMELASGLKATAQILKDHNLTASQLKQIVSDRGFRSMYVEAKRTWNSSKNATERSRHKAAMAVEDGIIPLCQIMHDPTQPGAVRLQAFKELRETAGITNNSRAAEAVGERFSLTIKLPGGNEPLTLDAEVVSDQSQTKGEAA